MLTCYTAWLLIFFSTGVVIDYLFGFLEMMSTAPLAQYHHPSVNGSQEKKPGPSSLPGDLKRKRFWPTKPKKNWEVNITLEEAAKQVIYPGLVFCSVCNDWDLGAGSCP